MGIIKPNLTLLLHPNYFKQLTLKQGVEVEIKNVVPSIIAVLDVTDHAEGSNPYYSPGKGGAPAK